MRKQHVTLGHFKQINGIWHKRCSGPSHEEPTYLPANEKYFYKGSGDNRKFRAQCRLCENWERIGASPGHQVGYIEVSQVWSYYAEAVARVGLTELARRSGISRESIMKVLNHKSKRVQKSKFRAVLLELISMRRKNEYSISNHARTLNEKRLIPPDLACSECGTRLENYTDGCDTCWDRKYNRDKRAKLTPEQKLEDSRKRLERLHRSRQAA